MFSLFPITLAVIALALSLLDRYSSFLLHWNRNQILEQADALLCQHMSVTFSLIINFGAQV